MTRVQAPHHYLEAPRLAFAGRNRYIGEPHCVQVPLRQLLSKRFGHQHACLINPDQALVSLVAMSPTIVLRWGKPWLVVGSPGGASIIMAVLQMLRRGGGSAGVIHPSP